MKIKILTFGQLSEVLKEGFIDLNGETDLETLKRILLETYPQLQNKSFVCAVNAEVAKNNPLLNEGDEVALLPPYAGG